LKDEINKKKIIQKDIKQTIAIKIMWIKIKIKNKLEDNIGKKNHFNKNTKKIRTILEKTVYHKFGLNDEIEN